MKTITVREMKAHWADVERQVQAGEVFVVLNRSRPTVRIVPAQGRRVLKWDNHLDTAIENSGKSAEETVREDRDGRW